MSEHALQQPRQIPILCGILAHRMAPWAERTCSDPCAATQTMAWTHEEQALLAHGFLAWRSGRIGRSSLMYVARRSWAASFGGPPPSCFMCRSCIANQTEIAVVGLSGSPFFPRELVM